MGYAARIGEVLWGKPEGKRPLSGSTRRWVDDIRTDFRAVGGLESTGWIICLAQNRGCLRGSVNTGEFLGLNAMRGICRPSKQPAVTGPRFLSFFRCLPFPSFPSPVCDTVKVFVKVFVRSELVSRLTHYILICRDVKES